MKSKLKKIKVAQIAQFKAIGEKWLLRLMCGSQAHLHLDLVRESFFPKKKVPRVNSTIEAIQEILVEFSGKEVKQMVRGIFVVNRSAVPEKGMIRSLAFETRIGDVGVKLHGARLGISGAPIDSVSWDEENGDEISIRLQSPIVPTAISEDYLVKALALLEESFNIFVLGKAQP